MTSANKKTGSNKARNSAARLLAVQAVYQMHKNTQSAESVVREYLDHRIGVDADGDEMVSPNEEHFALVVRGVAEHIEQLSDMVGQNRTTRMPVVDAVPEPVIEEKTEASSEIKPETETVKPLPLKSEPLLQGILLCGAFELMVLQSVDAPIIISDYLHVAHAFYDEGEAKLINGVLDSIRKTVRT